MTLSIAEGRDLVTAYNFRTLFIEKLGWNRYKAKLDISIDGRTVTLTAIAEKCGMAAFVCDPETDGRIPDYPTRRKVERQVAKSAHEHLIIFTDKKRCSQVWQWVRRERGRPAACREHRYQVGQPGDSLIQKIRALAVSLEEEERLTLPDVTGRARKAFDVEHVTKRFYERFKTEHSAFLSFLEGIPDKEMERWYVSVMLNRLMFVSFIQKKGFLGGGDTDYLKNKLIQSKSELGKNHYYKDLLCPLFFEGFAKRREERSERARELLGEVPYLNGGIFMPHQIEQLYGKTIDIPDKAFDRLFEFFEAYHWHLDERPLKKDDEINPDVLGYIFEKYINQKQMGAYYTKEDITEYIGKNTICPFLLDAAQKGCRIAFEGNRSVWRLLQEDPDRYIYKAMRHGVSWDYCGKNISKNEGVPIRKPLLLPQEIEQGVNPITPNLLERRKSWNNSAPPNIALPTESWREVIARRKRYKEVYDKLATGEIRSTNDLITYNLDIRQFAQDVIEYAEGPELLVAFWKAVGEATILDPACGSGAFLFSALNILDPLYEACLERMQFFLNEWGETGEKNHPNYYKFFSDTLKRIKEHPNHRYFILKSIIIKNLYGVDIMEEAVEICKLRLFLKLIAQIERIEDIEPLPDIDFNIRAGNTLVGFTKLEEVRSAAEKESSGQGKIVFGETEEQLRRLEEEADNSDRAFIEFRELQTRQGLSPKESSRAKEDLRSGLKKLTDELDRFLASEYDVKETTIPNRKKFEEAYEKWRNSHQPFHWLAEFYGILKAGGFDVIIGNPPYVEWRKIESYSLLNQVFTTLQCGNVYASMCERSYRLLASAGRFGMIVPISCVSTDRMEPLRSLWDDSALGSHISLYSGDAHPSVLFNGVKFRLSILLQSKSICKPYLFSTHFRKWLPDGRDSLFPTIEYCEVDSSVRRIGLIPKTSSKLHTSILLKLCSQRKKINDFVISHEKHDVYCHRIIAHFVKAVDFVPFFENERDGIKKSEDYKVFSVTNVDLKNVLVAVLNSSLFYIWFVSYSDVYHCGREMILDFPIDLKAASNQYGKPLNNIAERLMVSLKKNSIRRSIPYKATGMVNYDEFYPRLSKSIVDELDAVFALHYGLTAEELDFVTNYDIKFRMGEDT